AEEAGGRPRAECDGDRLRGARRRLVDEDRDGRIGALQDVRIVDLYDGDSLAVRLDGDRRAIDVHGVAGRTPRIHLPGDDGIPDEWRYADLHRPDVAAAVHSQVHDPSAGTGALERAKRTLQAVGKRRLC